MRNNEFKVFGFSAASVLKFSTEIDIFSEFPKNKSFSISSTDYPVQCCPEKAILMQKFWSWYLMERFSGRFNGKSSRSGKQSDLVHFLMAQGKVVPPFPCTLFFTYFLHLKITN